MNDEIINEMREQLADISRRLGPMNSTLSRMDAQIRKNRTDQERTNAQLAAKIVDLWKRMSCCE